MPVDNAGLRCADASAASVKFTGRTTGMTNRCRSSSRSNVDLLQDLRAMCFNGLNTDTRFVCNSLRGNGSHTMPDRDRNGRTRAGHLRLLLRS